MRRKKQQVIFDDAIGSPDLAKAWTDAAALFGNTKAMRLSPSHMIGLVERTGSDRMRKLVASPRAARLREILSDIDDAERRRFRTMAAINHEQASAAMRINVIGNISVPVGFLLITNQLMPNKLSEFVEIVGAPAVIASIAAVLFILLLSMWYAYAGVYQARDLHHLAVLDCAEIGEEGDPPAESLGDPSVDVLT